MSGSGSEVDPVTVAVQHADLGLPVPRTRLRLLKRFLARIGRLFLHHQVAYNQATVASIAQLRAEVERQALDLAGVERRIGNDIAALRSDLLEIHQAAVEAQTDSSRAGVQVDAADSRIRQLDSKLAGLAARGDEMQAQVDAVRRGSQTRHSLVDLFLRELRREYPLKPDPERLVALPSRDDDFYQALEDAFRGSFEQVTEWQRPYLSDLKCMPSTGRVLDIGSGRGEWLDLLAGQDIDAYGVDISLSAVERCRDRGLEVVHGDAFDHLSTLPDASLAAVTAFHVVEHLRFDSLIDLLDQAVRVLRPSGILIFETPNPTTLLVGSSQFLLDPTHQKPVHPAVLEFLFSTRGFDEIEVRYLHPTGQAFEATDHSELAKKAVEPVLQRLNVLLFGAQDYAVLGRRTSD